jgi:hypothetical protein
MGEVVFEEFKPNICPHCQQTTEYENSLDRGSAVIVIAIANAQRILNQKFVHVRKEMLDVKSKYANQFLMAMAGKMTETSLQNVLRPKYHGLIAQGKDPGTYLLTKKGAKFLRGEPVVRSAVVDKLTHSKKRYLNEHITVTLDELMKSDEIFFWEGERAKLQKLAAYLDQELDAPSLW